MTKNTKILTILTLILGFVAVGSLYFGLGEVNFSVRVSPSPSGSVNPNLYHVTKVVDGDTIEVSRGDYQAKVRFIGINTPETVDPRRGVECFGKEASNETQRLLKNKDVILEKDVSETDKYDRLLRYIYLPMEDGTTLFVNDYLVRAGFGQVSTYPPDVKYQDEFMQAESLARENKLGLWGGCMK